MTADVSPQDVSGWATMLRELGYPAVFVIATALAWWRIAAWSKPHAEALIKSHLNMVDVATRAQESMRVAHETSARELAQLAAAVTIVVRNTSALVESLTEHRETTERAWKDIAEDLATIVRRLKDQHG